MSPVIDVIVRTLADAPRAKGLFRALDSIQDLHVPARPIVVVNGTYFDKATMITLERRPGIFLYRERHASARLARAAGRLLATARYFAYLDDDDELIKGSLLEPLNWLESHKDCDVLVSNGYFVRDGEPLMKFTHMADHIAHPSLSLLGESWLQPGAFICRTKTVPYRLFASKWSNLEWTHLAFELCAEHKKIHFMDIPTVRYNDTPGSMSKDMRQNEAALDLLYEISHDARMDLEVRQSARRKYLRSLHDLAWEYWRHGNHQRAWRCHLASLQLPYTLKYLLFTRKLILKTDRRLGVH